MIFYVIPNFSEGTVKARNKAKSRAWKAGRVQRKRRVIDVMSREAGSRRDRRQSMWFARRSKKRASPNPSAAKYPEFVKAAKGHHKLVKKANKIVRKYGKNLP